MSDIPTCILVSIHSICAPMGNILSILGQKLIRHSFAFFPSSFPVGRKSLLLRTFTVVISKSRMPTLPDSRLAFGLSNLPIPITNIDSNRSESPIELVNSHKKIDKGNKTDKNNIS